MSKRAECSGSGEGSSFRRVFALFAGALLTVACSHQDNPTPTVTFDDLGGGSPIILTYPGVTEEFSDRQPILPATHYDRQEVPALCKKVGRVVSSDPTVGETKLEDDTWVQVLGDRGIEWATAVYLQPDATIKQLPDCPE